MQKLVPLLLEVLFKQWWGIYIFNFSLTRKLQGSRYDLDKGLFGCFISESEVILLGLVKASVLSTRLHNLVLLITSVSPQIFQQLQQTHMTLIIIEGPEREQFKSLSTSKQYVNQT
jgi:hypothetical protein